MVPIVAYIYVVLVLFSVTFLHRALKIRNTKISAERENKKKRISEEPTLGSRFWQRRNTVENRELLSSPCSRFVYFSKSVFAEKGIYVGQSKVVHLTAEFKSGSTSVNSHSELSCSTIPDCGFQKQDSGVAIICLNCFLRKGSLYRYNYGVTTLVFLSSFQDTCTTAPSDPPKKVVDRAMYLLQNGFGNYNLFRNNCEDFALYCKTELWMKNWESEGRSGQVLKRSKFMGPFGRYSRDIGVRKDVFKVTAEDLPVNLGCGKMDEENIKKMKALKEKANALRRKQFFRLW